MKLKKTQLHIMHKPEDLSKKVKTGVSLHCHTEYSKEMLDFVPVYSEKLPIISYFWAREQVKYEKREGKPIDFSNSFWSPPLNPIDVYNIEKKQINDSGLNAIISLTDHDAIEGNREINNLDSVTNAPISLEWTVPFLFGFFHLGVHNLPPDRADEITQDLLAFTFSEDENPDNERLHELFELLNSIPDILIIFNHPIWDIEMAGQKRHEELLKLFLKEHGKWIHALEINGFRSWSENKRVIEMAEVLGFPLATGGDRHGCKPNTVLNLTNKDNFSEFVEEIRVGQQSEVVLMPEYSRPLHSRQLESFAEILSNFPDFREERRRWFDRIFFDGGDGLGARSLSNHGWVDGGPKWLRIAIRTLGFLGSPSMRPVFAMARQKKDRVPIDVNKTRFEAPDLREISAGFPASPESTGSAG